MKTVKLLLKILKRTLLVFLIVIFCVWVFLPILNVKGMISNLFPTTPDPYDYENTIWECEEADIFFIVDKSGHSMGAAAVDSKQIYFGATWITELETFEFEEIAVDETGRSVVPYPLNNFSTTVSWLAGGEYTCSSGRIKATAEPEKFHLWKTDEPVTLTFVCKGTVPEVDLYGAIDPICRMEVIR